ncbi:unnamed protein product [Symbiodinium sp. KB8]|nr:unnamed protein product [Symbiodinium sp. KB8]
MLSSRVRLRAAVCFGFIGAWTLSFVPPLSKDNNIAKSVVVVPLLIAQTATAAETASVTPQQAGPVFPPVAFESLLYSAAILFVGAVTRDLISSYIKRMKDTNELRFSSIEEQLKEVKATIGEVKVSVDEVKASLGTATTVFLAILFAGIGTVLGPFLLKALAVATAVP